ncbi:related to suppressor protein PSP1 [Melanopsichium pennsylvanicum]|uniref:Related to suppressor protein PSP1 n=2 Tax=Melanopsichium pennsylvanicum TaxID=63383 RepID=A0AAJ4XPZ9_9BASI|nr:related to suppressor protein PSP1 [Melanopsichium pennsylvanicum 4]SNX86660.1 related to suppressor protein PSP1 [Melanopsichium pennsylvanicum]
MVEVQESGHVQAVRTNPSASSSSSTSPSVSNVGRRHTNSSSPDSSPTPSNPSHPASLNGDDARHGTSPATSVDGPSVPPSGLKLDMSSTTAQSRYEQQASLSRAGVARSPHPLDSSQEMRASIAARSGGILATMQEEGPAFSESRGGSTLGFEPNPSFSQMEQAMRASRNRSASSAAALALHGNSASFVDRWASNASGRIAPATGVASRSIWDGSNTEALPSGGLGDGVQQRPLQHLQRGYSASFVRNKPEPPSPSPFLSSPAGFHDLGLDFDTSSVRSSRVSIHANSSPFGAASDLPELSSYPDTPGADGLQHSAAGSESRRHSVAGTGPNRDSAGVIGGHRRAIGFDTAGSYAHNGGSRDGNAAADGGWPRHGRDRSVSSVTPGFNPFAGGSLALSMDDLADDIDFEPSSQNRGHGATSRPSIERTRSGATADSGAHAASMPSAFDERGINGLRSGSSSFVDQPRTNRTGVESLSATWDMAARSPVEGQQTFAEISRQLREMSIGPGDMRGQPRPSGVASIFDSQAEGMRTVRGSPGTSPSGIRGSSGTSTGTGHGLSAQARSFTAFQPVSSLSRDQLGGIASVGPSGQAGFGFFPTMGQHSRLGPQMPTLPPYANPQQLAFGTHLAGPPGPGALSALSSNDLTFSSLAALGPMPPCSMGPPRGLGGLGGSFIGPGTGAGTTDGLQDLGKGVPLSALSKDTPLYIVEFKQGRTDLFFRSTDPSQSPSNRDGEPIRRGDLVIVEADRGKDLGTMVNDSITVEQVQAFLAHQSDLTLGAAAVGAAGVHSQGGMLGACGSGDETSSDASGLSGSNSTTMGPSQGSAGGPSGMGSRPMRTINPKRLFNKATAADATTLFSKAQDEERALQLCQTKVMQRGLPMSVVAAEMQWDRRKLTFYYTASMRVDFRDLVKELFRLYKTRIWMCHLGHPSGAGMG